MSGVEAPVRAGCCHTNQKKYGESIMAKKNKSRDLTLPVSKQTAGGVTGAVLGGMVGGPVGAVVGGVTGALIGEASAEGKKPMKQAYEKVKHMTRVRRARPTLKLKSAKTKPTKRSRPKTTKARSS